MTPSTEPVAKVQWREARGVGRMERVVIEEGARMRGERGERF